jgi:hypothetical protein
MYFANSHSHFRYGIHFSRRGKVKQFYKLQKKVIRLISNAGRVTSCRKLFKTLNILPVPHVYNANFVLLKIKQE